MITGLATYGLLWTLIESIGAFFPQVRPAGFLHYSLLIFTSAACGIWRSWPPSTFELPVPGCDSKLVLEFGDIFQKRGCIALQVNEFFDSQLGDHVSPNSLHGKFIRDVLQSRAHEFDQLVAKALASEPSEQVQRHSGNTLRYRIGTTATIDVGPNRYLLFALSRTDVTTLKAYATVHELWDALAGLWAAMRVKHNGYEVFMPLVGGGLSGVGLPARNLIQILITSFAYYTKKEKITSKLTIILQPGLAKEIDPRDFNI